MQEMYSLVRAAGKTPKNAGWNDVVKAATERNKVARKKVLGTRNEDAKSRCMEVYIVKKKERLIDVYIIAKMR